MPPEGVGNVGDLTRVKIGRNLERQRHVFAMLIGKRGLAGLQRAQQGVEFRRSLQLAQVPGIGRGNVDCYIAGPRIGLVEAEQVIIDRLLDGCIEVLPDIDAENAAIANVCQSFAKRIDSRVVEAHAVDDGLVFRQSEHAGLGIARLRAWRDRTYFQKAKAKTSEAIDRSPVLVEPCRQPDAVGELESHDFDRVATHGRTKRKPKRIADGKKTERQFMGAFGIKGKEKWPDQGIRIHGAGFYDVADKKIFPTIGKKMHEGVYTLKMPPYNRSSLLIAESPKRRKFFKNQTTDRCRCLLCWRWWWVVIPKSKGWLLVRAERLGLSSEGSSQELREGSAAAGC